jgi:hypothetical protein
MRIEVRHSPPSEAAIQSGDYSFPCMGECFSEMMSSGFKRSEDDDWHSARPTGNGPHVDLMENC